MKSNINPDGFYRVDLWRGCYLLLTATEYYNGLKRGKSDRRRQANSKRTQREGNILKAFKDDISDIHGAGGGERKR